MAKELFTNNATAELSGTISSGGLTLVLASGQGNRFPTPTGGDMFRITVFQRDLSNNEVRIEVMHCTARTGDTLTVLRDVESITGVPGGYAYPENPGDDVFIELRATAGTYDNFAQITDLGSGATQAAPGDHTHGGMVTETGTQTLTNKTLTNPTITNYVETRHAPSSGTSFTVDLANGTAQRFSTSGNVTITLPSSTAGKSYVVEVAYGGTHTVTFAGGGTLKWAGGTAPTATSVNGKIDRYVFACDGTNTLGVDGGRNF